MATLQWFRGDGEWLRGQRFDGDASTVTLRRCHFDGDASTANGFLFFRLGFFLFSFGFLGECFFFLAEWVNVLCFLFGTIYSGI